MKQIIFAAFLLLTACASPDLGRKPVENNQSADEKTNPELTEQESFPVESPSPEQEADLIFHGGQILTMDNELSVYQALAVKDQLILAVGSDQDVLALQGDETVLISLEGRTLMPGFVDAHTHLLNDAGHYGTGYDGMQQIALENGITTFANMYTTPEFLDEIVEYDHAGGLRTRVSLYMNFNTNCGDPIGTWWEDIPPTRDPGEMLRIGGVKIFTDGGSCNRPALSYETSPGSGLGDLYLTGDQVAAVVTDAQQAGHQVAIHALGDRAIEAALDGIETALKGAPNTYRHRIEHNAILRPDLLPRYSEIGVVATIFGTFPSCIGFKNPSPDPYNQWEWAWNNLIDSNPDAHIAWHGDDPSIPPISPILELYGFVTRKQVTEDRGTVCDPPEWMQDDLLTVEKALPMMTRESAYALFREDEVGTLEPGKFADLIILSEDPLSADQDILLDTHVLMTMVGGKLEYCAAGNQSLCPGDSSASAVDGDSIPFGYLDRPAPGETLSGTFLLAGWALDDLPIARVEIYLDGTLIGSAVYGISRPDVANDYPGREGSPNFGFSFELDTSLYTNGPHTLSVLAINSRGDADSMFPGEISFSISN